MELKQVNTSVSLDVTGSWRTAIIMVPVYAQMTASGMLTGICLCKRSMFSVYFVIINQNK